MRVILDNVAMDEALHNFAATIRQYFQEKTALGFLPRCQKDG